VRRVAVVSHLHAHQAARCTSDTSHWFVSVSVKHSTPQGCGTQCEACSVCCLPAALQVSSAVHVYGHSHINADMELPTAAALDAIKASDGSSGSGSSSSRRYVQYALDAVGAGSAGLYCLWDGSSLAPPGTVLPITGP
jgi:hypothetical protein